MERNQKLDLAFLLASSGSQDILPDPKEEEDISSVSDSSEDDFQVLTPAQYEGEEDSDDPFLPGHFQEEVGVSTLVSGVPSHMSSDVPCASTTESTPRPFYTFNQASYDLMVYCIINEYLPRPQEIKVADPRNGLASKRWKRLQGNLRVIEKAISAEDISFGTPIQKGSSGSKSEYRLTWKTCGKLWIVPIENWTKVFHYIHIQHDQYGTFRHLKMKHCHQKLTSTYQYRRSRCGITIDDLRAMYAHCSCQSHPSIAGGQ